MKQYWYLVASLPYLRFGEKPPMSRDAFLAACAGHLSDAMIAEVEAALESREPPIGGASSLWNAEIQLRNAVARIRAKHCGADAARFIQPQEGFSVSIEKMVTDAFTRASPLEQEAELDRIRWAQADELALSNPFGFPGILAFAVKLRIAERWEKMSADQGRARVEELISVSLESDNPITDNG